MERKELYLKCPPEWHYELSTLIRQAYPFAKILDSQKENTERIEISDHGDQARYYGKDGRCLREEKIPDHSFLFPGAQEKNHAKQATYGVLNTGMPWGILTGVRPSKVAYAYLEEGKSPEQVRGILEKEYKLRRDKAYLAAEVACREQKLLRDHRGTDISIYVGIPFCPTRCSYCSFISNDRKAYAKWGEKYCEALIQEIRACKSLIRGRRIRSFYMGGGTPTTLTGEELDRILTEAEEVFDFSVLKEITVEAGRPDTITKEKLQVLRNHRVDRLSINPQSMNQETLDRIGRRHSVEQVYEAFDMARHARFDVINMDFILGLPGEETEHVLRSMEGVKKLKPENLTIHTLAIKRASDLNEKGDIPDLIKEADKIEDMLAITAQTAEEMGLMPYYMYRQKNMAGNFENVGYSLPGKEGLYNVEIMEERQTILALGAGGVTKVYTPAENKVERIANVKTADEYINRIEEMIERKIKGGIGL